MIDNVSVLVSTVVCLIVLVQAVKLDRVLPWFRVPPPGAAGLRSRRGAKAYPVRTAQAEPPESRPWAARNRRGRRGN